MHKKWYDYLWIWSILYFSLGFFNILFEWIGMIDFIVPLIFAAAAGTTTEAEKELRAPLTEEQCLERSAELAAYREMTLPWLCRAFTPEMDEAADIAAPAPEETPIAEEVWTLEDGYAALNESATGRAYLELLRSLGFDLSLIHI